MTQSTLGDTSGTSPTARPTSHTRSPARANLHKADYERAFDVLEQCADAACLPDFKERAVDAISEHFALKHVSFFAGPTFHTVFEDTTPLTAGKTSKMLPEYQDRWARHDVFGTPAAMRQLVSSGVSTLDELQSMGRLPSAADAYVRYFLTATWRMQTAAALRLELSSGHTALLGMFDPEPGKIGPAEAAALRLLSRQMSAMARGLPPSRPQAALAKLSERQRQVARLVADGLSNAQIAEILSLAEDSVKKYVTRILTTTGCKSRMELALLARAQRI
ncbi:LuxR C-terminal-related transcriptional regulator [Hoyosella sp. YIM 151337]|uniref:helix-turn-helix transcriptional regulator n=1 Tax=Hoyosella sp. YIM 151337 TaxID=2992742 RepID=UPI002235B4F7|nr:LuxR C-terminal-related transcriptional regulator [Hoyosella sp. YIM 151337]MCW4354716.1 LuxR C-terminal-related transcriptional regulator [Hoyosella sp. YIM 151337]